jgi:hypothetical protein
VLGLFDFWSFCLIAGVFVVRQKLIDGFVKEILAFCSVFCLVSHLLPPSHSVAVFY